MTDLEKDREDRSKRIMDRRVLQVTTLQELGEIPDKIIHLFSPCQPLSAGPAKGITAKNGGED